MLKVRKFQGHSAYTYEFAAENPTGDLFCVQLEYGLKFSMKILTPQNVKTSLNLKRLLVGSSAKSYFMKETESKSCVCCIMIN